MTRGGSGIFALLTQERLEREKSAKGLTCYDEVGACERQFPWLVPRVYFEALSKFA